MRPRVAAAGRGRSDRLPEVQVSVLGQAAADAERCRLAPGRVEFGCNKRAHGGTRTHIPSRRPFSRRLCLPVSPRAHGLGPGGLGLETWPLRTPIYSAGLLL